jgi:hypothetical protein
MGTKQLEAFCVPCDKMMPHNVEEPSNGIHIVMTLLTVGLWLIFWIPIMIGAENAGKTCAKCGAKAAPVKKGKAAK